MSDRLRYNEKSLLLSDQENEDLFNMLGKGCVTLSTAVVQLFLADDTYGQTWNKKGCGVVCFVKDNPKRSFFIRLYDPISLQKTWEQELYLHFQYKAPREFFHTFEAHDCQAGLNFASEEEAARFQKVVQDKLLDRQKRRQERKKQHDVNTRPRSAQDKGNLQSSMPLMPIELTSQSKPVTNTAKDSAKSKDKGKGKGKKKITKADISTPTHFRHVGHVGWDPESGLQTEKLDPEMKALFEEIGLNDQSQVDEDTMEFIYDFVDKHGGLKAVREHFANRKLPPAPPSADPDGGKPPQLPSRPRIAAPDPPNRGPPPPSRPSRPMAAPPPTPSRDGHHGSGTGRNVPPAPPLNIPAAPPPPPPSYTAPPPPPPTSAAPPPPLKQNTDTSSSQQSSGRAGLLDAIVNFKSSTLTHVQPDSTVAEKHASSTSEAPGGIAAALMDALNKRKPAMQFSDDDDGSSDDMDDDDDDEWDD